MRREVVPTGFTRHSTPARPGRYRSGQGIDMDAVRRFFSELRRRKVYKVAAVYAAVSFVVPRPFGFHDDPRFPGVLRGIGLCHLIPLI